MNKLIIIAIILLSTLYSNFEYRRLGVAFRGFKGFIFTTGYINNKYVTTKKTAKPTEFQAAIDKMIYSMGLKGWELVSVNTVSTPMLITTYYFKR